jgi:hypothetical protein
MEDCNKDTKLKIIEMPEEKVNGIFTIHRHTLAFALAS